MRFSIASFEYRLINVALELIQIMLKKRHIGHKIIKFAQVLLENYVT